MAERATVFEAVQIGAEVTSGTAVSASKRLMCIGILPRPMVPVTPFRPVGGEANVDAFRPKEWTSFRYEGPVSYTDLTYVLASLLVLPTPAAGVWTFAPLQWSADVLQSYSIEVGSAVRAEKFNYGMFNSLQLRFTQTESAMSGEGYGRGLSESASLTSTPTELAHVVVDPKTVGVKVGTAAGNVAAIGRGVEIELSIRNRSRPQFVFDPTIDSFTAHLQVAPELQATMTIEHDSEAAGYMADLRAKTEKYIQINAASPTAGYDLQITWPCRFLENDRQDNDGLYASVFRCDPFYSSTSAFNTWLKAVVTSTVTAL